MNFTPQELQLIIESLQLAENQGVEKNNENLKIYILQLIIRIKTHLGTQKKTIDIASSVDDLDIPDSNE